ncbi:MAG: hypothetical protein ACKVY0_08820 [Prosthecobacter sp.]|uniref:hypothetical protein n=1 Tax=Prosthecobacter sp. TaxID=1965333 RepID=UPI0039005FAB
MNAIEDPIVAEVRANREAIFASCDYDHTKFNAHMREVGEQLKREGWVYADRPIVRRNPVTYQSTPRESFTVREDPPAATQH